MAASRLSFIFVEFFMTQLWATFIKEFIMLSMILFGSFITAVGVLSIIAKASPRALKTILGYECWVDLTMSILISIYVGFSGTISGMVIGALTGVFIGMTLFIGARAIGYIRYEKNAEGKFVAVEHPPVWTPELFKNKWSNFASKHSRQDSEYFASAA